jgi:saccharopine dehydrogenase-like NADP-dependent oxidoreductase
MKNVIVIGAGMVGSAMAIDLLKTHKVTVADYNKSVLEEIKSHHPEIHTLELNVKETSRLAEVISGYDIVISAVPGFLGYETLKTIIERGRNVVDISFFPENALELDTLAKSKNVTAVVDCGVAPGMDNLILGYYNEKLTIDSFECYVGGLPKLRKWPFNYKAPFSPIDVIEEYTRPARYVENGQTIIKPAMSDLEHMEFLKVGTLEAFNTDGLRSLIYTMGHIPNMIEKTLRYPGHIEKIQALKDTGFLSKEPIIFNDNPVIPFEFTSRILFNEWKLDAGEEELTVMKVRIKGEKDGVKKEIVYDLYDEYDISTGITSMARTTGYTATAVANLILEDKFSGRGVFPPELIGKFEHCFDYIMKYLSERKVKYTKEEIFL